MPHSVIMKLFPSSSQQHSAVVTLCRSDVCSSGCQFPHSPLGPKRCDSHATCSLGQHLRSFQHWRTRKEIWVCTTVVRFMLQCLWTLCIPSSAARSFQHCMVASAPTLATCNTVLFLIMMFTSRHHCRNHRTGPEAHSETIVDIQTHLNYMISIQQHVKRKNGAIVARADKYRCAKQLMLQWPTVALQRRIRQPRQQYTPPYFSPKLMLGMVLRLVLAPAATGAVAASCVAIVFQNSFDQNHGG